MGAATADDAELGPLHRIAGIQVSALVCQNEGPLVGRGAAIS